MAWRRRRTQPEPEHDVSIALVLARLETVVDRLEGVYDQLAEQMQRIQPEGDTKGRGGPHA